MAWKAPHRAGGRASGEAFLVRKDEELSSDQHKKLGITTHMHTDRYATNMLTDTLNLFNTK